MQVGSPKAAPTSNPSRDEDKSQCKNKQYRLHGVLSTKEAHKNAWVFVRKKLRYLAVQGYLSGSTTSLILLLSESLIVLAPKWQF